MKIIVAHGENNEIGKDNELLWRLKPDMAFFVEVTKRHGNLLCGRKTLESIPGKHLPGRNITVLSKSLVTFNENQRAISSLENITEGSDFLVIGGEQIYRQTIHMCTELFITKVNKSFPEADSYFPDYHKNFKIIETIKKGEDKGLNFSIERWVRLR